MNWKLLEDEDNKENGNAGNGGDLVKHTVYLATLRFFLTHEPLNKELHLRECHAGRGVYKIPRGDVRCELLSRLHSNPATNDPVLLQSAQRKILGAIGCLPNGSERPRWYAGSALINASTLADAHPGLHKLDLYEWQPETRRILRSVLTDSQLQAQLSVSILPAEEHDENFDGEAYIEQVIGGWGKRDLVLLDPFAMWRQPHDQTKRDRYGAIVDHIVDHAAHHRADVPSLILFWTWGHNFTVAHGDLKGTNEPVKNGYSALRGKFHNAGVHFVRIKWRWGLQFAMWVVVPQEALDALRADIDMHCRWLLNHLYQNGCGQNLSPPTVEVEID